MVQNSTCGSLSINQYATTLTGLECSTNYEYKAFIHSGIYGYTGNSECTTTPAPPVTITLSTCPALSVDYNSIDVTGGVVSPRCCGLAVDYYGMQYRIRGTVGQLGCLEVSPTEMVFPYYDSINVCPSSGITICGQPTNSYTITKTFISGACGADMSWVCVEAPEPPAPLGISQTVSVLPYYISDENVQELELLHLVLVLILLMSVLHNIHIKTHIMLLA